MIDHGLFETVRVINGVAPLWALHLARLRNSAASLGIPVPILAEPNGGPDRVIRIEVRADTADVAEGRDVGSTEPLALVISPAPHRGYPHKSTDRAWLEAARTTEPGAFEARMTRCCSMAPAQWWKQPVGRLGGGIARHCVFHPSRWESLPAWPVSGSLKSSVVECGSSESRRPTSLLAKARSWLATRRAASCRWQCSTARRYVRIIAARRLARRFWAHRSA